MLKRNSNSTPPHSGSSFDKRSTRNIITKAIHVACSTYSFWSHMPWPGHFKTTLLLLVPTSEIDNLFIKDLACREQDLGYCNPMFFLALNDHDCVCNGL